MTACRIGRVRMKNGGADVRVLRTPEPYTDTGNDMMRCASIISRDPDLQSYIVVGMMQDGRYNCGFYFSANSPIPPTLTPSYIAEIVRRECVTQQEAVDVFNNQRVD